MYTCAHFPQTRTFVDPTPQALFIFETPGRRALYGGKFAFVNPTDQPTKKIAQNQLY